MVLALRTVAVAAGVMDAVLFATVLALKEAVPVVSGFTVQNGAEDGGQTVFGFSADKGQDMPVALEGMLVEEPDATVADTHGVGGEVVDIFSVQEVLLKFGLGEAYW